MLTSHQVRIIRPRAGSSGLTPNLRALFGRIIRPKARSSDHVLKQCAEAEFLWVNFSQEFHLMSSILTTWNSFESVPLIVRWNLYSNSNWKLKLNPDWIHHTNFEIGDLPFIFFLFFSFYSCTHFLQSIISPNCDCQKSPKSIRGLDALSVSWWD